MLRRGGWGRGASLLRAAAGAAAGDGGPSVGPPPRFINARRRILQPMLDSSCSETPKTKKKTAQNRPVQRFWPDSIASGAAQPPPGELAMSEGTGRPGRACGDTAGRGWPRARGAGRPSGPASSGRGSRCVPRPLLPLRREGGGTRARRSVPVRGAREGGAHGDETTCTGGTSHTQGPRAPCSALARPRATGGTAPSRPGPRPLVARVLAELGISALTPKTVSER